MVEASERSRIVFADAIRSYAIVLVLLMHIVAPFSVRFTSASDIGWWIENLANAFSRPCIPLFIILSGMLLLNPQKKETISVFFHKRFFRVLLPFFAWAIVYLIWRYAFLHETISIWQAMREIIQGPVYYHFWFIYMLLGLYLITPILRSYVKYADRINLYYFLTLWFLGLALRPLLRKLFHDLSLGIDIPMATGYVGYFVGGFVIASWRPNSKLARLSAVSVVLMVLFTAVGTYLLVIEAHGIVNTSLYDYLYPNIIIASVLTFLVLKSINYDVLFERMPFLRKSIDVLSRSSLGIFFLHPIILGLLERGIFGIKISCVTVHPLVGIPLTLFIVLSVSFIIVRLLQKIPLVRYIVP